MNEKSWRQIIGTHKTSSIFVTLDACFEHPHTIALVRGEQLSRAQRIGEGENEGRPVLQWS